MAPPSTKEYFVLNGSVVRPDGKDDKGNDIIRRFVPGDKLLLTEAEAAQYDTHYVVPKDVYDAVKAKEAAEKKIAAALDTDTEAA